MAQVRADLLTRFDATLTKIADAEGFQKRIKDRWRAISYLIRIAAAVFALVGMIAPVLAGRADDAHKAAVLFCGYGAFVVAGGMVFIDQVFFASRTWSRAARAELDIRLLHQLLEIERTKFELTTPDDDTLAQQKVDAVHAILEKATRDVGAVVIQETQTWATDLAQSNSTLQQIINSAIAQSAATASSARAHGAIQVIFKTPQSYAGKLRVTVVSEQKQTLSQEFVSTPPSVVFPGLAPGIAVVNLGWPDAPNAPVQGHTAKIPVNDTVVLSIP